ncbi:hypothetical protein G9A89_009732 [Geosiphon pyriformis]|nr:hypothetical protein G9A89_009732 [Geosiphon pyriformis]
MDNKKEQALHYLQLRTEDLNSETLATYFQEFNFNIIEYCEEKYPVQFKYSLDFESETETSNKGKQKVKQYSKTTPNTPILPKTTAKHLQTPEQGTKDFQSPRNPTQQQEPILTSANIIDYLQENESNHSESLESKETESEQEKTTENKEEIATAYIAKIPEFTGENNDTSPQEWLDKVQKAGDLIAKLKDKLIKKVRPHVPENLATAIRHAKNYEMAMEKANHTKLVNLAIGETSSAAEEKIDQLTKKQQYQQSLPIQQYQIPYIQQYQVPAKKLVQHNQFTPQNQFQNNNNRINPNNQLVPQNSGQQRPNHYHTQPSYFTMSEKLDFQQTALSKDEAATPKSNPSNNNTISPAQIAQNANLSDIFSFEFKANESPFLLSNAAANKQKAITAMYTKATVEGKPI